MSAAEAEVVPPETESPKKTRSRAMVKAEGSQALEPVVDHRQPTMEEVLMKAVEQGASIETLERIFAMIEKSQAALARREYYAALSRFQEAMPVVPKTRKVNNRDGSPRFSYAPIEVIKEMARPYLAANGLSVISGSRVVGEKLIGAATANHVGGHSDTREFEVPITLSQFMSDQQSFAAASSFAERCAYRQVTGIVCAGEDNEQRITPTEARAQRQPVNQPRQTPTAQRAEAEKKNGNTKQKPDLDPAGEGEAIDTNTVKGLAAAMEHAKLGQEEFKARFPKLAGLEQVKKTDTRVVMSWIADPSRN